MMNVRATWLRVAAIAAGLVLAAHSFAGADDRREDVLRYGLESDILPLIKEIEAEGTRDYDSALVELYAKTRSPAIREAVLGLFAQAKVADLREPVLELLEDPYDARRSLVVAALEYAGTLKLAEAGPAVRRLAEDEDGKYRDAAIKALGRIGGAEDVAFLTGFFNGEIPGDEKTRLIVRQNVMFALAELHAPESEPLFLEAVRDEDENAVIRATAAEALGKIGSEAAVKDLARLFEEQDPILRVASVKALGHFSEPEASAILLEGFKDAQYKVRLAALDAAAEGKSPGAYEYVLYRAKHDPVDAVKLRAYEVLPILDSSRAKAWLFEILENEKTSDRFRVKAAAVLLAQDPAEAVRRLEPIVIATLKDDKRKTLRYELGKEIAKADTSQSAGIAEAYLTHKDVLTRSIGFDMFAKNRYPSLKAIVEGVAADEKQGALQRRAKRILDE